MICKIEWSLNIKKINKAKFKLLKDILDYLTFQPFDFERTWWWLFKKRVVRTKFDLYVFISDTYVKCQT